MASTASRFSSPRTRVTAVGRVLRLIADTGEDPVVILQAALEMATMVREFAGEAAPTVAEVTALHAAAQAQFTHGKCTRCGAYGGTPGLRNGICLGCEWSVSNPSPSDTVAAAKRCTTCRLCGLTFGFLDAHVFETFEGSGPYEVECQRTCVRCPSPACGALVDVPSVPR